MTTDAGPLPHPSAATGSWRVALEVDVAAVTGASAPQHLRGWAMGSVEPGPGPVPVLYCQAGGGCSTPYFDLQVPGRPGYSMAEAMVRTGAVVVAVDHLGLGASDAHDLFAVTPTLLAACHDLVATEVLDRLVRGTVAEGVGPVADPFLVGVGHSMGAMLTAVQQGRHGTFGALVLLGHGIGLPEVLTPDELAVAGPDLVSVEHEIVRLATLRFGPDSPVESRKPARGHFFAPDVPDEVRAAFGAQAVPTLPVGGLTSMIPHATDHEKAAIEVPVFLAFGDDDLVDDYLGTAAAFTACRDLALYVLADSGHCQNQAAGRHELWRRMTAWIDAVAAGT